MAYFITDDCCGCALCARQCPVMAVTPDQRYIPCPGGECLSCTNRKPECPAAGAPKHPQAINARRCVECGVCGWACPKGAVTDALGQRVERVPRGDWPRPVIAAANCSACGICVHACAAGALDIAGPRFRGDVHMTARLADEEKCVGCGLCARECPMGAIEMKRKERHEHRIQTPSALTNAIRT